MEGCGEESYSAHGSLEEEGREREMDGRCEEGSWEKINTSKACLHDLLPPDGPQLSIQPSVDK